MNAKKLAELLFQIINASFYNNEISDKFHDEKEAFWEGIEKGTIEPATWGLLYEGWKYHKG